VAIKNEAFIDLELALRNRLENAWNREWAPIARDIIRAVGEGDFQKARDIANSIDTSDMVDRVMPAIRTISRAALLLGASRLGDVKDAAIKSEPPTVALEASLAQLELMFKRNITEAIREEMLLLIATEEEGDEARTLIFKADFVTATRTVIKTRANQFFGLGSSLQVSRMNSLGFFAEAIDQGVQNYVINEVLDDRTCPVCLNMHGKVFPVAAGAGQASSLFMVEDPDAFKSIAPWPSQDKASVASLGKMTTENLIDGGITQPPFHPFCRGIVDKTSSVPDLSTQSIGNRLGILSSAVDVTDVSEEALTNRLFGNRDDIKFAAINLLGAVAAASLFEIDPEEEKVTE